jgi:tetratricopeptide (TPR) repeat protein
MLSALFDDHFEAFLVWREAGLSGLTCVHVDAHLDVSADGFSEQALQGIAKAKSRDEVGAFRGNPKLPWGGFHCGNYLYPALLDGTVTTFVWVVPAGFAEGSLVQNARQTLQNWLDMRIEDFRSLKTVKGRVEGQLLGRRLVICTSDNLPEFSPEEQANIALDIDVDYFVRIKDDRMWQSPHQLRRDLGDLRPVALTVATSCEGGYTPLSHRWLGQVCLDVFKGDPESWRAETEELQKALEAGLPPLEAPRPRAGQAQASAAPKALTETAQEPASEPPPEFSTAAPQASTSVEAPPEALVKPPQEPPTEPTRGSLTEADAELPGEQIEELRRLALEQFLASAPEVFRPSVLCALDRYAEAESLDPQYRPSPFDEAGRLFQKGRFQEGLDCLERTGDGPLERGFLVALLAAGASERVLSLDEFDRLLGLPGLTPRDTARLLVMQAQILADKEPRKALEVLQRAVKLEPERANSHHMLGTLLRRLGQREDAAKAFRKGLRLAKGKVSSLALLLDTSRLYDELGQKAMARATRRELEDADATGYYAIQAILDTTR